MIVITGSIASGKSTVCKILQENGYAIVDADKIARELIDPEAIRGIFGERYIKDGEVDRKALGELIFNDPVQREKLNRYIHPLIRNRINQEDKRLKKAKVRYIADIPLYFESGNYDAEIVAVVYCPKESQIKRLMKRESLSEKDALKRIENQMDIEEKRKRADYTIDNSKDLAHLLDETEKFMEFLDANIKI